jgi:hypothetical protein
MKKGEKKTPDIHYDPFATLGPDDKAWLRGVLVDPRYVRMLRIIQRWRPSSNCKLAGSNDRDAFSNERASARLAEMRGWDAYEMAIFQVLTDKPASKASVEPSYPESGAIDADWGKIPSQTKT